LYGPGRANEHTNAHLVAGFGDPAELEPEPRPGRARDIRRLAALLPQPPRGKPVWHCSVRAAPGDRELTDEEWAQVTVSVMDRTGLAPVGDELGVRWVAVRHAPDHIHLVATLARQDGTQPPVWNDYYRVRQACREAEQRFGLRATAPADRTAARRPPRAEHEQAARRGWDEPPRVTLRREVCTAAAGARTEHEFFARLQQAGVVVRERRSSVHRGQVTGYAVGLPRHTARDGTVIWYGGGKLAADLTLPKLRARWGGPAGESGTAAGPGVPGRAVRGALRILVARAAAQAQDEASFFAGLRESGVLVRLRFSEIHPGQVTGYSVTLPGHHDENGAQRWYGGGRLAADLTLPQLRQRWTHRRGTGPERVQAFRFTAAERDALYQHAARHAAAAAEHIRQCTVTDPARAAYSAWAVADTLHVAARALRNRTLRCAADAYDRAARAPHGRVPARSQDGQRLRSTARLLALAGDLSGGTIAGAALLGSLVTLTTAVAELRQAQHHAAQAAAARAATAHLHEAITRARTKPVPTTPAQARRPSSAGAAETARRDVPAPPDLSHPPDADQHTSRPHPRGRHVPLPPRRAGPHI
jgi:hypothetical protein